MKIFIVDFDDSFTYNIASCLFHLGLQSEVIHYKTLNDLDIDSNKKYVLIYGPGPGHPDEYQEIFGKINYLFAQTNVFSLGICLGHQLIWRVKGATVIRSSLPVHGRKREFKIPKWDGFFDNTLWGKTGYVQYYNSLIVKSVLFNETNCVVNELGESVATKFLRGLTYQFHPESIGTSFPDDYFGPILKFLYN